MCNKRLKTSFRLLVLFLVLFFSPLCSFCYAEVILTDEGATEMLNEIQESKKDLNQVRNELEESKKESQKLKTELQDAKSTYKEQRTSYEAQLNEAEEQTEKLKITVAVTSTSSVIFCALMIVFMIL